LSICLEMLEGDAFLSLFNSKFHATGQMREKDVHWLSAVSL